MEFAVVVAAFVAVFAGLGALWKTLEVGLFLEHATASASHHVQGVLLGNVADVFLY